jgi:hypothetical protein
VTRVRGCWTASGGRPPGRGCWRRFISRLTPIPTCWRWRSRSIAYRQVASELAGGNGHAVVEIGKVRLERLGPAPDPPRLAQARAEMQQMMPRVDLPDVLLEIFGRTGPRL